MSHLNGNRGSYWRVGLVGLGAVGAVQAIRDRTDVIAWLLFGAAALIWAGLGLIFLGRVGGRAWAGEEPYVPPDARPGDRPSDDRPADGEVGIVPMAGVIAAGPIEGLEEFRRFERLDPGPGEGTIRSVRVWGRRYPPLLGRVAIVSVFVGRDGKAWSDDELIKAHRALRRAGAWIEREAIRWQVPVNLDLADTFFSTVEADADREVAIFRPDEWGGIGLPDPDAEARILGILGRSAAHLGFQDPVDLLGRVGRRIEADQIVWLLHVRRAGKSIAMPSDATGIPGVAVAVCYAKEDDFEAPMAGPPFPDPITFVHELMHLFGASDKYDVSLSSFPRGTVSERDVMVLGIEALSRLRVEPLTAVEIGWAASPTDRPAGPSLPLRGDPPRPKPKPKPKPKPPSAQRKRPRRP